MRRLPMFRTLVGMCGALVLSTSAILALWRVDRVGLAPGALVGGTIQVCSPRDGIVAEVLVRAGREAAAGEPLVRLDTRELQVEAARHAAGVQELEAQRGALATERKHLVVEVHPREREEAAESRERARLRLEQASLHARAMARLGEDGIAGTLQVEQTRLDQKLAEMALEEAGRAERLLAARQRARVDQIDGETRRLDEATEAARVQRDAARRAIEDSVIRAPRRGSVVASGRIEDLAGRSVAAGAEILRLAVTAPDRFRGSLGDADRAVVRSDQPVRIRLDAYPWLLHGTLHGRVARVADRSDPESGGFPVEVEVDPASAPGPLTEGMRGTARIVIESDTSLARILIERAAGRAGP